MKPQIKIADISIPEEFENRGFFFFGDPGTRKTQSIKQTISVIKHRSDFRGIVFDPNGEMLKEFYDPQKDVIYDFFENHSVDWCHTYEKGVRPEIMAEALIPPPAPEETPFFRIAARVVLAEVFRKAKSNRDVYHMITKTGEEVKRDLEGTLASRYLAEPRFASNIIATVHEYCGFYRYVDEPGDKKISFYNWALSEDPRWIFVTLKQKDVKCLKPLHSMLFELMLKGLLSNQNRQLKTAIIIDDLNGLNKLSSLKILLNESRKFLGCPFLGTKTHDKIVENYGDKETNILLGATYTKLMLRCSDEKTSEILAKVIGKQEIVNHETNLNKSNIKFVDLPKNIRGLSDDEGYLKLGQLTSEVRF